MDTATVTAPSVPQVRTQAVSKAKTKRPTPWNVVLLNDDDHSYEYVIAMVQKLFGAPVERAFQIAKTVDKDGRAVCMTTHRELAELKMEQIHGFGKDMLISGCAGSMSAVIEPAECGDDENGENDSRA
ncbi:MAG TPA: ATP-dependent Clp protease adaptor ClpS [Phycisphaerales bacterium]|nr:ATP-dependent Clp protease adaptor ClpS [Phycisphaerales bacterium]